MAKSNAKKSRPKAAIKKIAKKSSPRRRVVAAKKRSRKQAKPQRRREPEWLRELREREVPLEVKIDEQSTIVAASYGFEGGFDFNITIHHPEGDFEFGWNALRRREKYKADTKAFRKLPYPKKKAWLAKRILDTYGEVVTEDDPPWKGGVKGMNAWLDSSDDCDYEDYGSGWKNEFLVGHPIHDALTPKERAALGIRQVDACSMASGPIMAVVVDCSMDDLNAVLQRKQLPFVVVADKRVARLT